MGYRPHIANAIHSLDDSRAGFKRISILKRWFKSIILLEIHVNAIHWIIQGLQGFTIDVNHEKIVREEAAIVSTDLKNPVNTDQIHSIAWQLIFA